MEARLQKWGNSDGIRIPSNILKSLNLKTNDKIKIIEEDKKIIITKIENEEISLKERIASYQEEKISETFEWDEPRGRELW